MEDPRLLLVTLAILVFALASRWFDERWFSMPTVMLAAGLAIGPLGLGWVEGSVESEFVKTVAEATLAFMLFHDAVRIDLRALRRGFAVPARLLGIGLPLMLVAGTAVAFGLLGPQVGLIGAALVATMLAPTDAALGEAVVSDERVPLATRQGLNVESGLNDGLSVPVFLVLLAVAGDPAGWETGALAVELVRQIGFGLLGGLLIGGGGGLLFRFAASRGLMQDAWRRIAIAAIAVGCFVAAAALGGSGFIGAFSGGMLFGLASEARSVSDNSLTGYVGTVLDAMSFLLLGAVLVPVALGWWSWPVMVCAALSLVLVRPVTVAAAMWGSGAKAPTVAFMGWFGPRGLATLVFAVLLYDAGIPNGELIASVAVLGVMLSVLAHGFSAPPLVARYARWWESVSVEGRTTMESAPVAEENTRRRAL